MKKLYSILAIALNSISNNFVANSYVYPGDPLVKPEYFESTNLLESWTMLVKLPMCSS
ncbi:MAG: hypothetical protein ACJAZ2_002450 [Glaciecola sp.]|jgi:hypothetical protein